MSTETELLDLIEAAIRAWIVLGEPWVYEEISDLEPAEVEAA